MSARLFLSVVVTALMLLVSSFTGMAVSPAVASGPARNPHKEYPKGVAPVPEAETARKVREAQANRGGVSPAAAIPDGRVYNSVEAVNIRQSPCTNGASPSCNVLFTIPAGYDVLNDASQGQITNDGYTWVYVTYSFGESDPCSQTELKGWVIVDPLFGGSVHVVDGPTNVRASTCSGTIVGTANNGDTYGFYQSDNQWVKKW